MALMNMPLYMSAYKKTSVYTEVFIYLIIYLY